MFLEFWSSVTIMGDPRLWIVLMIFLLFFYRNLKGNGEKRMREQLKTFLMLAIPVLILIFFLDQGLKHVFQIPRPCIPCPAPACNPYCPRAFSFPSGHTSAITSMIASVCLAFRKRKLLVLFMLAAVVGLSRIILGVHRPEDVAVGFVLGIAAALVVWKLGERIYRLEKPLYE